MNKYTDMHRPYARSKQECHPHSKTQATLPITKHSPAPMILDAETKSRFAEEAWRVSQVKGGGEAAFINTRPCEKTLKKRKDLKSANYLTGWLGMFSTKEESKQGPERREENQPRQTAPSHSESPPFPGNQRTKGL